CLVSFFVKMWLLKAPFLLIFPVPVSLKRFLAPDLVFNFGILLNLSVCYQSNFVLLWHCAVLHNNSRCKSTTNCCNSKAVLRKFCARAASSIVKQARPYVLIRYHFLACVGLSAHTRRGGKPVAPPPLSRDQTRLRSLTRSAVEILKIRSIKRFLLPL